MKDFVLVFLGAGLGGCARHGVNLLAWRTVGTAFPTATLVVNITGSLLMGWVVGHFAAQGDPGQSWRLFLATGVLGGYTTFSAFSLEAVLLHQRGDMGLAAIYVLVSVIASVGALLAGMALARWLG